AVHIGPAPAAQSYLVIEKIIDACRQTGAQAVHPGYGFLSEREAFPRALAEAGITFIGPNPGAMVEWMKQVVTAEAAKAVAGKPSLYNAGAKTAEGIAEKLNYLGYRIDSVYQ
ncbi:biotin carboxylase N-terminal domain-containing protein, partial [Klebsiella pneumoniae]|uniref:biotin carboxylase N-terminal domain-containing protein n=1 Tax=Klebsiella pneumoniae TaxID=573 RepID=UPI0023B88459